MIEPLVVFDNVVKRFGNFIAVKEFDLEIKKANSSPLWGRLVAVKPRLCACWLVSSSQVLGKSA